MTPIASTEKTPKAPGPDETTASPDVKTTVEPEFHRAGSTSFRQALLAGGAVLLALAINLALLAFIGYLDSGETKPVSSSRENTRTTISVQSVQEVQARTSSGDRSEPSRTDSSGQRPARETPPEPRPVMEAEPIQLSQVSSDFEVPIQSYQVRTPAPDVRNRSETPEETSSGSEAPGSGEEDFGRGELDKLPRKTSGPDPIYPPEAKRNRTEGWVMLELDISRDGTVTNVEVVDWMGDPNFKQSALKAVRQWTFKPGEVDGQPVDANDLRQRITFNLVN